MIPLQFDTVSRETSLLDHVYKNMYMTKKSAKPFETNCYYVTAALSIIR